MQRWMNWRSAAVGTTFAILFAVRQYAKYRFRLDNYEGPWGTVIFPSLIAIAITSIVGGGGAILLWSQRKLTKGDMPGLIFIVAATLYLAYWVKRYLQFAYPG